MTYWRTTHVPVHVVKIDLCCFPSELVPPPGFSSKDAVLVIMIEWHRAMSSLNSLTFHFPISCELKMGDLFSHFSCPSCQFQRECFCFFVPHIFHWHEPDSFCLTPGSATSALNEAICCYEMYVTPTLQSVKSRIMVSTVPVMNLGWHF
jgi:hypothetical protein